MVQHYSTLTPADAHYIDRLKVGETRAPSQSTLLDHHEQHSPPADTPIQNLHQNTTQSLPLAYSQTQIDEFYETKVIDFAQHAFVIAAAATTSITSPKVQSSPGTATGPPLHVTAMHASAATRESYPRPPKTLVPSASEGPLMLLKPKTYNPNE